MNRRTAARIAATTFTLLIAAQTAWTAARYGVPATTIGVAVGSIVYTGLSLSALAARPRTKTYTCPVPDCGTTITTTGQDDTTNTRYAALAADHTRHGQGATAS